MSGTAANGLSQATGQSPGTSRLAAKEALSGGLVGSGGASGVGFQASAPSGWQLEFSDDFTQDAPLGSFPGTVYGSRWYVYRDGMRDTTQHGAYFPSTVLSVHNGYLDWRLHTDAGVPRVAAVIPEMPQTGWGQQYGRFDIRYRADAGYGYKIAFLLWPDDNLWPAHGEIDFPETDLGQDAYAALIQASPTYATSGVRTTANTTAWHVATTEWSPGKVVWYMDGQRVGQATTGVPSVSMHWVLQVETSTTGAYPSPALVAHVQVDWVKAYLRTP